MLKNKLKTIRKQLNKLSETNSTHIFFADLEEDGNYIVRLGGNVVCEGNQETFEAFQKKYNGSGSVFIVDDIPRPKGEVSWWNNAE